MLRFRDDIIIKEIDETDIKEGIIMDLNMGTYIALNSTALMMIQALQQSETESDAISNLTHKLNADKQTIETDLFLLLDKLKDLRLIA